MRRAAEREPLCVGFVKIWCEMVQWSWSGLKDIADVKERERNVGIRWARFYKACTLRTFKMPDNPSRWAGDFLDELKILGSAGRWSAAQLKRLKWMDEHLRTFGVQNFSESLKDQFPIAVLIVKDVEKKTRYCSTSVLVVFKSEEEAWITQVEVLA